MNQILHKTFLDSLLASTQQSLFSKSFAFDWARSVGSTLETVGDFGGGNKFTGTNQDDTVIIGGNLTGGKSERNDGFFRGKTSINLLDGNDTLTVKGNVVIGEGEVLSILGGNGTNTINIDGDVSDTSYYNGIELYLGERDTNSAINVLNVAGSVNAPTVIEMYGAENHIDIGKNLNSFQGASVMLWTGSKNNVINIHGDINIEQYTLIDIRAYNANYEDTSSTTAINVDGNLNLLDQSSGLIGTRSTYAELNFKDITLQNSHITFELEGQTAESTINFTVDGNILLSDKGNVMFHADTTCNLVVSGSF